MIQKFSVIKNLAVFENFAWDSCAKDQNGHPLLFKEINILYGRNYSGKTTLSRIIRTLETHKLPEKYENPQFEIILGDDSKITQATIDSTTTCVRVFNEDFVRTNLRFLIDPNSEIAPFAILGANNAEIEEVIKNLEAEIGTDAVGQEAGLYKQLKEEQASAQKAKNTYDAANNALEKRLSDKATDRKNGIRYNSERFGDQNYSIAKIKQDIAMVTAPTYKGLTTEKKKEYESTITEQAKPTVHSISIPSLQVETFSEKATEMLARKIGSSNKIAELLYDAVLNEWVKRGKSLLDGKDVCAFCGNTITEERWKIIHAHFDEESKKFEAEIDDLLSEMDKEKKQIQAHEPIDKTNFYAKYFKNIDDFINAKKEAIEAYCSALDSITDQLQAKKAQITIVNQFTPPVDNSATATKLFEDFNNIIAANNKFSTELGKAKNVAQAALRLQEVADFCATIGYEAEMKRISALKVASDTATQTTENIKKTLKSKKDELQASLRQLNDEEEGAKQVNKYLNDYFGHHSVTLEAEKVTEGESRIRFRIMRDGKPAFNLSEGERSLIAFCYFMAKLDDIETYGVKPIIWIDDPISSLDSNHIYFMYSLIVAKIAKTGNFEQLFVSTHSLDFLKYLRRLVSFQTTNAKPKERKKEYFLIEREMNSSKITTMPKYLKENATEFNYLFSIIYKCSNCETITDDNYDMLYGFGNSARKFLEILLYFQYPDDSDDLQKLKRFLGTEEIPPILTNRLLNENSHGPSPEGALKMNIDPEIIPVAKKIIEKLSENTEQYKALRKSIGVPIVA